AEDGIRDRTVTGVQTCALPIYVESPSRARARGCRAGRVATLPAARECAASHTPRVRARRAARSNFAPLARRGRASRWRGAAPARSEERRVGKVGGYGGGGLLV